MLFDLVESLKGPREFEQEIQKVEEVQKEIMLWSSMNEEQAIPELRRLKEKWKKLYEEGKSKDKYEQRALFSKMKRIEADIAKKEMELAKADLGIRSLDKVVSIMSTGEEIFKDEFWNKIKGTLTYEKLMDIMMDAYFNEKRVLKRLCDIANINDKHVLNAIDQLPDEKVKEEKLKEFWNEIELKELDEILEEKI